MGTHRLAIVDTADFYRWVKNQGYSNEFEFWQSLSGLTSGTIVDHMVRYLSSLGYHGTPNTQFAQFLKDQVGLVGGREGTIYDMANELFPGPTGSYGGGSGEGAILDGEGNAILDSSGNAITEN